MNSQQLAFEKLSKLKVGALFMEMGTGKTKVALDLINYKKNKVDYILWICPYSIKEEIRREIVKWHSDLNIEIVGCETIGSSDKKFLDLYYKLMNMKTFLVVDESLKIKNQKAIRTQRILRLGRYAEYKLILNGTPVSKNVLDLWTQMEFLSPKILNMSFIQFKNSYCEYYQNGRYKNFVKAQYNINHLISLIKPYIFDAELDLGKLKNYHSISYEIEDKIEYENIKRMFLSFENDISFFRVATSLQKCYCTSKLKKRVVEKLVKAIDGQVIVFVKFLNSIPSDAKRITGDEKNREEIIKQFENGEFKALYITYGCGSFGLNLQFCKNVIFADHTFDYSQQIQAEARIYRIGQENDVDYYNVNCNCGLENLILKCIDKKVLLLSEIKEEIERKGKEEWLKSI